ncbi:hypothetical protein [Rhizobium mesoamericanum]|uniref:Uncharacterized protein n=1 Tax=Rhizobium mesoamericanum STM3625 TaxID=1211777 RepID=K0Q1G9_9HYPH|nr:hypothetical protein [Rhizobium mesoamericanum]CCM76269.1 hypothetical protein BN77_0060 [Rhizobium mesoamericanum STM3625]
MDNKMQERLKAALEENERKDREFAEKKRAEEEEAVREAARKAGAASAWPDFVDMLGRAATALHSTTAEHEFLFEVKESPAGTNFLKSAEAALFKNREDLGAKAFFHLEPRGYVRPVFVGTSTPQLEPFEFFSTDQEKLERLLIALLEFYVKGRSYKSGK